ncbi:late endosomal/lysosomal adaptor and MAPK and MTOR activator-domain-containing protein [Aspergillus karnatakaensis]|uniref:LAMTOR1/MEH1 family protein n=1 Tax=Aspergillus karnatakaensis TaxID=1810916 RepID=UPI003CCD342C
MGICSSCLGVGRRENDNVSYAPLFHPAAARSIPALTLSPSQPESSRLLDDDIYQQPGYNYGALNNNQQGNQPDPGYVRREREALEAICQRTSDSVIDIWSLQPQPHLQPQATLHNSVSSTSSKAREPSVIVTTIDPDAPAEHPANRGAVPKHWGEVVINPRKGKRSSRPGSSADEAGDKDVFGVLKVS